MAVFEEHVVLRQLAVVLEWTAHTTHTGKGRDEEGLMRKHLLPLISISPVCMRGFTASAGRGRTFVISENTSKNGSLDAHDTLQRNLLKHSFDYTLAQTKGQTIPITVEKGLNGPLSISHNNKYRVLHDTNGINPSGHSHFLPVVFGCECVAGVRAKTLWPRRRVLGHIERIGHDGERTTNRPFHRSKHGPREHSACSTSESVKNRECTPNWGIPRFRRAVGFLRENGD